MIKANLPPLPRPVPATGPIAPSTSPGRVKDASRSGDAARTMLSLSWVNDQVARLPAHQAHLVRQVVNAIQRHEPMLHAKESSGGGQFELARLIDEAQHVRYLRDTEGRISHLSIADKEGRLLAKIGENDTSPEAFGDHPKRSALRYAPAPGENKPLLSILIEQLLPPVSLNTPDDSPRKVAAQRREPVGAAAGPKQ